MFSNAECRDWTVLGAQRFAPARLPRNDLPRRHLSGYVEDVAEWKSQAATAIDQIAGQASAQSLVTDLFSALRRWIPTRTGMLYRYEETGEFCPLQGTFSEKLRQTDPQLMQPENDPSHELMRRLSPRPRVVRATTHETVDRFRKSAAYHDLYRPLDIEHIVCVWINGRRPAEPGMLGMMLARNEEQGPFTDDQVNLLREALPLLTMASERSVGSVHEQPVIEVGHDGEVLRIGAPAEKRLARVAIKPSELLTRLAGPIRRWRELGATAGASMRGSRGRLFQLVEKRGESLFVEVLESSTGLSLRLIPKEDAHHLSELRHRHGLTPTEIAVLQALSLGLSNVETAAYLCVSTETVKTHVRRLLNKLGLSSRLQAGLMMQRIVFDTR